ncbi:hypothetical protein Bbelb_065390 [Branchiostoma belcheri]|nr:hypothetical protein Bbelb_065390 [Branchiostoma belcheri]
MKKLNPFKKWQEEKEEKKHQKKQYGFTTTSWCAPQHLRFGILAGGRSDASAILRSWISTDRPDEGTGVSLVIICQDFVNGSFASERRLRCPSPAKSSLRGITRVAPRRNYAAPYKTAYQEVYEMCRQCCTGHEGADCTDINECASYPCLNGGTCRNLNNTYRCDCVPGWTGVNCEIGYVWRSGTYYKVFTENMTYTDASQTCAADGGHLADVTSQELQEFLLALPGAPETADYWIGLQNAPTGWTWSDGGPIKNCRFIHWAPSEPSGGDCGALRGTEGFTWDAGSCDDQHPFICQIGLGEENACPEPCPLGYLMCGEENSCLLAWRWCDGGVDCTDGKDEENCECWTIPGDFNNSRLAMLPNQLGHKTFEEIQNSSVAELLNFNSNPEGFHPEFGQFVSTILYPRCNVSEENMCSSSENADDICTGKLLLPCRSWCEEVFNTADDRIKNLLPGCDVFPPPQHGCWHPEPDIKNKEVCYYGSGSNYRGTGSTTLSGAACVEWTAALGGFYTTEYPWANLVHNYCRNPTGLEGPFCITEDGSQEECDLIPCNAAGCLDLGPPNYGRRSPGKRFYFVGERVAFTCNEGYSIKSGYTNEVRCIGNGRWEYVKPICSVNMRGRLEKELLEVYSPNLAPERNVLIGFTGFVEQIVDLDEKKEQLIASVVFQFTWHDSRLGWDPKYYDGIDVFSVPGSGIWTPALNLKRK